jgi:hypothetical protein
MILNGCLRKGKEGKGREFFDMVWKVSKAIMVGVFLFGFSRLKGEVEVCFVINDKKEKLKQGRILGVFDVFFYIVDARRMQILARTS